MINSDCNRSGTPGHNALEFLFAGEHSGDYRSMKKLRKCQLSNLLLKGTDRYEF
jgi:hypothetical protein